MRRRPNRLLARFDRDPLPQTIIGSPKPSVSSRTQVVSRGRTYGRGGRGGANHVMQRMQTAPSGYNGSLSTAQAMMAAAQALPNAPQARIPGQIKQAHNIAKIMDHPPTRRIGGGSPNCNSIFRSSRVKQYATAAIAASQPNPELQASIAMRSCGMKGEQQCGRCSAPLPKPAPPQCLTCGASTKGSPKRLVHKPPTRRRMKRRGFWARIFGRR